MPRSVTATTQGIKKRPALTGRAGRWETVVRAEQFHLLDGDDVEAGQTVGLFQALRDEQGVQVLEVGEASQLSGVGRQGRNITGCGNAVMDFRPNSSFRGVLGVARSESSESAVASSRTTPFAEPQGVPPNSTEILFTRPGVHVWDLNRDRLEFNPIQGVFALAAFRPITFAWLKPMNQVPLKGAGKL